MQSLLLTFFFLRYMCILIISTTSVEDACIQKIIYPIYGDNIFYILKTG